MTMADESAWRQIIERRLLAPSVRFADENPELVKTVFLTGSYASDQHDPASPNVNVYFIATTGRSAALRLALGRLWPKIRQEIMARGANFLVDCHPYTVSVPAPYRPKLPTLTLTTKVFDDAEREIRYRLPATIGLGWLAAYKVLWGSSDFAATLQIEPRQDLAWFQAVHEALGRYRNMLDHLPWALNWIETPQLLTIESLRYAEEALRDGIAVTMSSREIAAGEWGRLYARCRKDGAPAFFASRYGEPGRRATETVMAMREGLRRGGGDREDEAIECWRQALEVWDVIWQHFRARAIERFGDEHGWLLRINSFV